MTVTPDTSPTVRFEGLPKEYNPGIDPVMHPVLVTDDVEEIGEFTMRGYKTDIPGAKVNLQGLAEFNKQKQGIDIRYRDVYFTTASGTIYRSRNLDDGTWQLESSSTLKQNTICEACTIEVGKRFKSPHLIDDQPELNTSAVQDITLVDISQGVRHDPDREVTDIATRFRKAVRSQGSN